MLALAGNLLLWLFPLFVVAGIRAASSTSLISADRFARGCDAIVESMYRAAVAINSILIERFLRIRLRVHGETSIDGPVIVISNHRTWFDILLLHQVITRRGPILKFLIKRELLFVPILGWLCFALGFPRLIRGRQEGGREQDLKVIATAAADNTNSSYALTVFVEGTRFTRDKHEHQAAPFTHLLKPRHGALQTILKHAPAPIIDSTIIYPRDDVTFWQCIGGAVRQIDIFIEAAAPPEPADTQDWLNRRWQAKDALIDRHIQPVASV